MISDFLKTKKIPLLIIIAVLILAVGTILILSSGKSDKGKLSYSYIEKGDIKNTISCTGTVNTKGSVDIGSQISGTISGVFADYNDTVKKNQVLATIDSSLLEIAVAQAESNLVKALSQYEYDKKNYNNNFALHEKNLISDSELEESRLTLDTSYAEKLIAETDLKKAKSNLTYASIKSPIDGKIIDRNVESGQTVINGSSSITLFTIANDLSEVELYALVDESDIGAIKAGQNVEFTVESYPDETFTGVVRQIRLQSVSVSNVVNYYVIISASNERNHLLPGMTATIDITIEEKNGVYLVINSALKLKATSDMLKSVNKNMPSNNGQDEIDSENKADSVKLWYVDNNNNLKFTYVQTGLSSGQKTEIYDNDKIIEGLKIVSGFEGTTTSNSNPSSSQQQGGGGGMGKDGPPPMF